MKGLTRPNSEKDAGFEVYGEFMLMFETPPTKFTCDVVAFGLTMRVYCSRNESGMLSKLDKFC